MRRWARTSTTRECSLAAGTSVLLAILMTWPALRHPRSTIPQDVYDPSLQAWQVAWGGHALLHDPLGIWDANVSFPARNTLAYSDSLLGYSPAGWFGSGPADAVLRYNLLFVLAFALATFGMYTLARQLGANPVAAAVAGAAFAYAPWRFSHAGHLNILSTGGIALALAMLARGHGFSLRSGSPPRRPGWARPGRARPGRARPGRARPGRARPGRARPGRARPGWAFCGWLVASWQLTLGFGLGVPFAYLFLATAAVVLAGQVIRREWLPRRLVLADAVGGAIFAAVAAIFSRPYLAVLSSYPDARRDVETLGLYSPPLHGFFTSPPESWLWGASARAAAPNLTWPPEMTLLPGFTLLALALAGLFVSAWPARVRGRLALGVVTGVWVAMGTATPLEGRFGYLILYHLPGFDGSRTPGRLVLWVLLLLCLLAAGAITRITERTPRGPRAGLLILPLLGVLLEGVNQTPHPVVPTSPVALQSLPAPILVLPTDELTDLNVMLWSTAGFPLMVNGSSGYNPPQQAELREQLRAFPDPATVARLRQLGVRTVVVLASDPGLYQQVATSDLTAVGVTRRDEGNAMILTL